MLNIFISASITLILCASFACATDSASSQANKPVAADHSKITQGLLSTYFDLARTVFQPLEREKNELTSRAPFQHIYRIKKGDQSFVVIGSLHFLPLSWINLDIDQLVKESRHLYVEKTSFQERFTLCGIELKEPILTPSILPMERLINAMGYDINKMSHDAYKRLTAGQNFPNLLFLFGMDAHIKALFASVKKPVFKLEADPYMQPPSESTSSSQQINPATANTFKQYDFAQALRNHCLPATPQQPSSLQQARNHEILSQYLQKTSDEVVSYLNTIRLPTDIHTRNQAWIKVIQNTDMNNSLLVVGIGHITDLLNQFKNNGYDVENIAEKYALKPSAASTAKSSSP